MLDLDEYDAGALSLLWLESELCLPHAEAHEDAGALPSIYWGLCFEREKHGVTSTFVIRDITLSCLLQTIVGSIRDGVRVAKEFQYSWSKAKFQREPNTGVTFDDVAGVDEAKQDFQEIVEFLKTPEKFAVVGARISKGVRLVGPTGTRKTLLAKAIARGAGVPFYSLSRFEFIEMFVGVGDSRVRNLFNKAKMNSPCLIVKYLPY
ncbi:hypothetical protein RJ639_042593 [Escallonia herrerae]|uniref:ATPase AAA-type core domain-containing protein n=1 Tax=Escallonia herrerae TaxID=1293975 RepID=A0AA88WR74_9ASTE|nr:hypothetical protein RJ639_042593 [Escallonia herrerae]